MKKFALFVSIILVSLFTLGLSSAFGHDLEESHKIQLEDYLDYETISNPQISPDGSTVLYSRRRIDKMNDKFVTTLWVMDEDGSNKRQLLKGSGAKWSPDGSRIAFMSTDDNDKPQLFIRHMDGEGLVSQITSFEHSPRSFYWSPKGDKIAFVARVPMKDDWSVKLPGKPKGAKWTKDPASIDKLHYRQDRVGYTFSGYDHIFVVPATGGTPRQLTDGDWNVGLRGIGVIAGAPVLSWSPDGKMIAFDGAAKPVSYTHLTLPTILLV